MQAPSHPRVVHDNAALAWRNCIQAPLHALSGDFVSAYRELLDGAATTAMATELPAAWKHTGTGFAVELVDFKTAEDARDVTDEVRWSAWNRAAEAIDPWALVAAAGLDAECHTFTD
jgi:hypothetical protein